MKITSLFALAILAATPAAAQQPPLSLRDALARAERGAYGNRIAHAQADAQNAQAMNAWRGILPTVRLEAGFVRTTDPIGAFGTTLRQRRIDQADFDPQRLNYPSAIDNYSSAVVLEAPLLNADAHLGRIAGAHAGKAANASATWSAVNTRVDVIRAYYGAVLMAEKVTTLDAALKAADAHVRQAEQMVKAGLATRSDALLASVKAGEVRTHLLEARGEAGISRYGLAVLLGTDASTLPAVPAVLPGSPAVRAALESSGGTPEPDQRADLQAAQSGASAARYDVARATSLYLPRINAIARYDWNSAQRPYAGDNNWTVGVMASWTPFAGASEIAERRGANARADAANAALEAARAQADLEMRRALVQREVALERLQIAEKAVQQSVEAHRIVARKYQGGLATAAELLEAAAIETQTRVALSQARYAAIVTAAESMKARGQDPARLADLLNQDNVGEQP